MSHLQEIQDILASVKTSTIQSEFVSYLQSTYGKNRNLSEITIPIPLVGNLDLGILDKMYPTVEYLYFTCPGKLTGLYNIPKQIKHLFCSKQLLVDLPQLPESLVVLNVSHNCLSKLDLFRCKQLERVHCEYNHLIYISGLPSSLISLYCHHNRLTYMDLISASKLEVFHHHHNRQLVLKNVPKTIRDGLQYTVQAMVDLFTPQEDIPKEYYDQLLKYFDLRRTYQEAKKKTTKLPKCYGCKKNVGMVFSAKDRKYSVYCGANPPCSWKMEIHRGFYCPIQDLLESYEQTVNTLKESIIQHKMDVIFNHMDEKKARELHKEEMEAYQSARKFLDDKLEQYENYYFSTIKNDTIEEKLKTIYEKLEQVKRAIGDDNLREAVEIEHHDIAPLYDNIQKTEYEVNEVDVKEEVKGGDSLARLQQEPVHFSKMEIKLT